MMEQLLLRAPAEQCSQVLRQLLQRLQDQAPGSAAALLPGGGQKEGDGGAGANAAPAESPAGQPRSGAGGSSGVDPRSHDLAQHEAGAKLAAQAELLEGPNNTPSACDLALALGVLGHPGGLSQRDAMLGAAAMAWPGDPAGVLALALMEDVVLAKGEAVLIPTGCPHAYVCGEVLEVQAASNNTIKGGLTAPDEPTDKESLLAVITAGLAAPGDSSSNLGAASASNPDDESATATSAGQLLFEGPPELIRPAMPAGPGSASADALRLYEPAVEEFQLWHVTVHAGHREVSLVVDPGPGVLLVTAGCGRAVVKAGVVVDRSLMDEADLKSGDAFFLPAGSSLSFSGSSASPDALEIWITTANTRFFSAAAAAAPAGPAQTSAGIAGSMSAAAGLAAGGAVRAVDPAASGGGTFTAAEQAAAAIMAGAAHSSTPVNVADATAATLATGVGMLSTNSAPPAEAMDTD